MPDFSGSVLIAFMFFHGTGTTPIVSPIEVTSRDLTLNPSAYAIAIENMEVSDTNWVRCPDGAKPLATITKNPTNGTYKVWVHCQQKIDLEDLTQ
jgi:hypothetical protein